MKISVALCGMILVMATTVHAADEPKLLSKVAPLPVALDPDFQFRKTKLFLMTEVAPRYRGTAQTRSDEESDQSTTATAKGGRLGGTAPSTKTATAQDASIMFEREYRLFGAVTKLDRRQRYGNYFDFFWRAKRPAGVTVRLEYRQEKLHAHVQAQEISYPNARGNVKTEFKVIGDDYFDDGRVIAWRCLLIAHGQIVSENRSYTWE
jgi:hypothetical protein